MQLSFPLTLDYLPAPREAESGAVLQIEALPPDLKAERARIIGSWSGGRRYVSPQDRLAHIWFHFGADGTVAFSIRYEGERRSQVTTGRWWLTDGGLAVAMGPNPIVGPYTFSEGVMRWAGEALVRVSEAPLQVERV